MITSKEKNTYIQKYTINMNIVNGNCHMGMEGMGKPNQKLVFADLYAVPLSCCQPAKLRTIQEIIVLSMSCMGGASLLSGRQRGGTEGHRRKRPATCSRSNADTKVTAAERLDSVIKASTTIATSTLYTSLTTCRNGNMYN